MPRTMLSVSACSPAEIHILLLLFRVAVVRCELALGDGTGGVELRCESAPVVLGEARPLVQSLHFEPLEQQEVELAATDGVDAHRCRPPSASSAAMRWRNSPL